MKPENITTMSIFCFGLTEDIKIFERELDKKKSYLQEKKTWHCMHCMHGYGN